MDLPAARCSSSSRFIRLRYARSLFQVWLSWLLESAMLDREKHWVSPSTVRLYMCFLALR